LDASTVSAWAAAVSAASTIAVTLLTARYVVLTGRMVAEMRAARRPSVFLDLEVVSAGELVVLVGNSGDVAANNVQIDVDDRVPWQTAFRTPPFDLPAFRDGIPYLAPNRVLRFSLGWLDWKSTAESGGWLNATLRYKGEDGSEFAGAAHIDLRRYNGVSVDTFERAEDRAADSLRELASYVRALNIEKHHRRSFRRACPSCAESISSSAKKCYHCDEWLDRSARPKSEGESAGEEVSARDV
jgi:hypothetical protein